MGVLKKALVAALLAGVLVGAGSTAALADVGKGSGHVTKCYVSQGVKFCF